MQNDKLFEKSDNKSKTIWNIINCDLGRKQKNNDNTVSKIIVKHDKMITEPISIANNFNEFFVNMPEQL